MIILNLIPEKEKKELQILNTYIAIKDFILVISAGIIISSTMLLLGKIILLDRFTHAVSNNILSTLPIKISNSAIKNIKKEIDAVSQIQKGHIDWITFFVKFNSIANSGITISALSVNDKGSAEISGSAKKRQDLIDFEKNINSSGYFKEYKFPYDALFKKENIIFSMNLEFEVDTITQKTQ